MAVDVGSATGYLDLDISGFLANLRTAQSEADTTSKNIATKIGNNITGIGKSMTSVGSTLTKSVTVPLLGIGTAGLKVASDFDSAMSGVKAISGATGEEFDALRAKAIELGGSTAFSANEVAEAMTEMAKAGWDSQQILDGMGGVLDAAAASGENLGTVSTIVADAITGFGIEAKESTRVADLLTQAANSGTIGINDLGESFKYIAPVAGSMGLSIEDVTTALSAMSMSGIKGSQAGTSLRGVLTRMVKPTNNVAAAMDKLGIVLTNSDGTFKSLDQILSEMRGSFSGLTDEQKTYYAATLAGQEGMSGLLSLLNMSQEEYDEIAASMDNATGVAQETAAVMRDNLAADAEELGGSLESLAITLAEHIIPHLRTFVQWLTQLINKFTALDPETQKTILKFAGIAAAIGPVILVIGKLVTAVGSVVTAIGGISAPVVAVVAVIATLVAAFKHLWDTNEEFRNNIIGIWNEIKDTLSGFFDGIVERLNALGFDFENIMDVLKAAWDAFCSLLAPAFESVFQNISNILKTVTGVLTGILDVFIGLFTGNWDQFLQGIKGIFESIWNGIKNTLNNAWEGIKTGVSNGINNVLPLIRDLPGKILDALGNVGSLLVNAGESIINGFLDGLKFAWDNVTGWIGGIGDWIAEHKGPEDYDKKLLVPAGNWIMEGLGKGLGEGFEGVKDQVSGMGNDIVNSFDVSEIPVGFELETTKLPEAGVKTFKDTIKSVYNDVALWFESIEARINGSIQRMTESLAGLISQGRLIVNSDGTLGYIGYNGFTKIPTSNDDNRYGGSDRDSRGGGDTFIFNSPKAIDEIEAARQMKQTKRDIAEGF